MDEHESPELTDDEKRLFADLMPEDLNEILDSGVNRRHFLKLITLASGGILAAQSAVAEQLITRPVNVTEALDSAPLSLDNPVNVAFKVNGTTRKLTVDSRMTLLDTLRERLDLTGSKKGCDHGQCGACTVMVNGQRVLTCLTLAASCEGKTVQTIEGLAQNEKLHPMQEAFLKHDGFQCGFCTPGQICSAVALLTEAKEGDASYVTQNVRQPAGPLLLSDEEIRERMSGNICRCGAYPNIVAAIKEVQHGKPVEQIFRSV